MSERKNINNLFQEKFENFEVTPDEMVWKNIEIKLKEKKKRRVIPFWWKLSGIAAGLLIGLLVYNNDFKTNLIIGNRIVNHDNNNGKANDISVNKTSEKTKKSGESIDANSRNIENIIEVKTTTTNSQSGAISNKISTNKTDLVVVSNNKIKTKFSDQEKKTVDFKTTKNNTIVNNVNKSLSNKVNATAIVTRNSEEKIAFQLSKSKKAQHIKSSDVSENNISLALKLATKEKKLVVDDVKNSIKEFNTSVGNIDATDHNKLALDPSSKTDEKINKKNDSIKIAGIEPNALEELQKEKEKKTITEPKLNRWQVSSNVAPIYFSSTSNGSPLDYKLENNDKSYATNFSYGLGVNYAVNKKIKVRTGLNLLNVDYNTNGISYYQSTNATSKLANLNPNLSGSQIIIENLNNVITTFNKESFLKQEGSLNQKLGYIEMPLEITYKVLDKKLGIDFISGMSTLILNKNEIYLQSSDLNLKIGEASNLNTIHFSGNVGLGFKYALWKHLDARVEPIFKYQIKTFSNDAGNFKPYVFGVYSGINYTF